MQLSLVLCDVQLGEQVSVARETLERALQLSYQFNLELNSLNDWLNQLVTEIHTTEDRFVDNPNSTEELRFYEVYKGIREISFFFCVCRRTTKK